MPLAQPGAMTEALHPQPRTTTLSLGTFDDAASVLLSELPPDWEPHATAAQHRTLDDCSRDRSARAARILQRLRSCGEWQLVPVTFGRQASFAGGLRCPHVDIIALPGQTTSDVGVPLVRSLARVLLASTS